MLRCCCCCYCCCWHCCCFCCCHCWEHCCCCYCYWDRRRSTRPADRQTVGRYRRRPGSGHHPEDREGRAAGAAAGCFGDQPDPGSSPQGTGSSPLGPGSNLQGTGSSPPTGRCSFAMTHFAMEEDSCPEKRLIENYFKSS